MGYNRFASGQALAVSDVTVAQRSHPYPDSHSPGTSMTPSVSPSASPAAAWRALLLGLSLLLGGVLAGPLGLLPGLLPEAAAASDPFRVEAEAPRLAPGAEGRLSVTIAVPQGFVVYRDMVAVEVLDPAGLELGAPDLPPGFAKPDPANPALTREQYSFPVIIEIPVKAPAVTGTYSPELKVRYQGCKASLCYPPGEVELTVPVEVSAEEAQPGEAGARLQAPLPLPLRIVGELLGGSSARAGGWASGHAPIPEVDLSHVPASATVHEDDPDPNREKHPVKARLLLDRAVLHPGETVRMGVHLEQAPGWHTYWKSPGDIGLPTDITWTVPDGSEVGERVWPVPERFEYEGIISYGYEDEVLHFVELTLPAELPPGEHVLGASASWLVCEVICIPGAAELSLPVTVESGEAGPPNAEAVLFDHFAGLHPTDPVRVQPFVVEAALSASAVRPEESFQAAILLTPTGEAKLEVSQERGTWPAFIPITKGDFMVMESTVVPTEAGGARILLSADTFTADPLPEGNLIGGLVQVEVGGETVQTEVLVPVPWVAPGTEVVQNTSPLFASADEAAAVAAGGGSGGDSPAAGAGGASAEPGGAANFLSMLLLAFLGGNLLNIMPCVLPVLTLKLYSLVEQSDISDGERRVAGLAYTGGIVASFVALALAVVVLKGAMGMNVGWGFQFQYPGYVAALATIVFLFGLSLFGVFEIPALGANQAAEAQDKEGVAGYFLTGVFATLLATPCSAPFLGTGMGFAFSLPSWGVVLFFAIAGLGLAFPFLVIAFVPALIKLMPRPGGWMEAFKQFMGFTLVATTVWLCDVLIAQVGREGLIGFLAFLTTVSLGAWIFGHWGSVIESTQRQLAAFAVGTLVAVAGGFLFLELDFAEEPVAAGAVEAGTQLDFSAQMPWQPFSEQAIEDLAGNTVFVDFTADWCLSCKVNEQTTLEAESVRSGFAEAGVIPLKADWTRRDETITRWLQRFGKAGVPFYLVIPADRSKAPIPLPEVITPDIVLDAISEAS